MGQGRPWPLSTERIVKYIANSAAKNISSLDNQMMVPTLTRFGRLAGVRGTGSVTDAVATKVIITTPRRGCAADPPTSPGSLKKTEGLTPARGCEHAADSPHGGDADSPHGGMR